MRLRLRDLRDLSDKNGRFAWSIVTGRKIYVSVRAGDVKAPRLIIR